MAKVKDFKSEQPTWCPGCGDFGVLAALQQAAAQLGLEPHQMAMVTGIGCSGKTSSYFNSYGLHGVHGRTLPVASGIKLANPSLTVLAVGGDGDGYSIGVAHLIHAARRNVDITYVVMNNRVYGLTKGQTSPTSLYGFETKTSPGGATDEPVRPLALAISAGASYVAQGFSGDVKEMTELLKGAITHKGFALVDVFSPCVTYNKVNTYDWYRERVQKLADDEAYDPGNKEMALARVNDPDHFYTGLLYQEERAVYDGVGHGLSRGFPAPAAQDFSDLENVERILAMLK